MIFKNEVLMLPEGKVNAEVSIFNNNDKRIK